MALTPDALKDLMAYGTCIIDGNGYDPYNHVGIQVRRQQAWRDMRDKMRNKIFVMDASLLDPLRLFEQRNEIEQRVRDKFLIPQHLLGFPVIRR